MAELKTVLHFFKLLLVYLSPSRSTFSCFPIRQPKSGPVLEPGSSFSTRPPSQTSMLSGCLYTLKIFSAIRPSLATSLKSLRVSIGFSPQKDLHRLYPRKWEKKDICSQVLCTWTCTYLCRHTWLYTCENMYMLRKKSLVLNNLAVIKKTNQIKTSS